MLSGCPENQRLGRALRVLVRYTDIPSFPPLFFNLTGAGVSPACWCALRGLYHCWCLWRAAGIAVIMSPFSSGVVFLDIQLLAARLTDAEVVSAHW